MMAEFRKSLLDELDYRHEAAHLRTLGGNLARVPVIVVPQPVDDYTTARVLTMDYVLGTKVTDISPLARLELDGEKLGRELVRAYLHQIIVDGFFHADPHPGNVFLTDDEQARAHRSRHGRPAVAADPGAAARTAVSASEGRGDEATDVMIELGERRESSTKPRCGATSPISSRDISTRRSRTCRSAACCSRSISGRPRTGSRRRPT